MNNVLGARALSRGDIAALPVRLITEGDSSLSLSHSSHPEPLGRRIVSRKRKRGNRRPGSCYQGGL